MKNLRSASGPEIIRFFSENPDQINMLDKWSDLPPLFEISAFCDLEVLKKFVQMGADINFRDETGFTVLHYACFHNAPVENIEFLLDMGMDINIPDNYRSTPLLYLCEQQGDIGTIEFMLERGADPRIISVNGDTCLLLLIENMFSKEVIEMSPDPKKHFKEGYEKVKLLVEAGSDLNLRYFKARDYLTHVLADVGVVEVLPILIYLIHSGLWVMEPNGEGRMASECAANATVKQVLQAYEEYCRAVSSIDDLDWVIYRLRDAPGMDIWEVPLEDLKVVIRRGEFQGLASFLKEGRPGVSRERIVDECISFLRAVGFDGDRLPEESSAFGKWLNSKMDYAGFCRDMEALYELINTKQMTADDQQFSFDLVSIASKERKVFWVNAFVVERLCGDLTSLAGRVSTDVLDTFLRFCYTNKIAEASVQSSKYEFEYICTRLGLRPPNLLAAYLE